MQYLVDETLACAKGLGEIGLRGLGVLLKVIDDLEVKAESPKVLADHADRLPQRSRTSASRSIPIICFVE
jgi:hypothetical protein